MKALDKTVNTNPLNYFNISKRNAYHQAGQAIGIYKWNKQKKLPPVHFQIVITRKDKSNAALDQPKDSDEKSVAFIEGGLLIQNPLLTYSEATHYFSSAQHDVYRRALEADVINLLAGFLTEAKYAAFCDNEIFNPDIIGFDALKHYGGNAGLAKIHDYMKTCFADEGERSQKLHDLMGVTFSLISKRANWRAICKLAEFIYCQNQSVISCEEISLAICSLTQGMHDDDLLQTENGSPITTNLLLNPQLA